MERQQFFRKATGVAAAGMVLFGVGCAQRAEEGDSRHEPGTTTTTQVAEIGVPGFAQDSVPPSSETVPPQPTTTAPQQRGGGQQPPARPQGLRGLAAQEIGLSMGDHFSTNTSQAEVDEVMGVAARYATMVRVDFGGKPDAYGDRPSWEVYDRIVTSARNHNLGMMALITYVDHNQLPGYAAEVARRYGPQAGGPVRWAEIWNEPNIETFWPNPSPEAYARQFVDTARAIKQVSPTMQVITGGLAPALNHPERGDQRQIAPITFAERALASLSVEERKLINGIGIHPYDSGLNTHNEEWSTWAQLARMPHSSDGQNSTLQQVITRLGLGGIPVYFTEFGVPTGGEEGKDQATQQGAMNSMLHDSVPGINTPVRIAYTLYDDAHGDPGNSESYYGILTKNGAEKPAAATLRQALATARS